MSRDRIVSDGGPKINFDYMRLKSIWEEEVVIIQMFIHYLIMLHSIGSNKKFTFL